MFLGTMSAGPMVAAPSSYSSSFNLTSRAGACREGQCKQVIGWLGIRLGILVK